MSEDCIFCRIVDGDIPARLVRETDTTLAFLDANPLARGHTLVIPKAHHARLSDLPNDVAGNLFGEVHELVPRIESVVDADATTVGINDGEAAGQEVPHVHAHIVPRFDGDGGGPIHAVAGERPSLSDDELDDLAHAKSFNRMSGATPSVTDPTPESPGDGSPDSDTTATAALVGAVGGAGTTRTTIELAATLARDGRDVAILDAAYATQGLADYLPGRIDPDVTALVTDRDDDPLSAGLVDFPLPDEPGRVACLPAYARFERLARAKTETAARALGERIREAEARFDYALVDTPHVAANQSIAAVTVVDRVVAVAPTTARGVDARQRCRDRLADLGVDLDAAVAVRGVDGTPESDPVDADAVVPQSPGGPGETPTSLGDDAFAAAMAEVAAVALGIAVDVELEEGGFVGDVGERVGAVLNR
jgi:diadenosine tetraphosphate (Ap4A) HIT family hydrolase/MinD-like ATPase involved in chromosome partitioning or flagellar assembly